MAWGAAAAVRPVPGREGRAAPPGPPGRYLVVPGAGGEDVGGLERGSGQGPPARPADLLRHELGAHVLHGRARPAPAPARPAPRALIGCGATASAEGQTGGAEGQTGARAGCRGRSTAAARGHRDGPGGGSALPRPLGAAAPARIGSTSAAGRVRRGENTGGSDGAAVLPVCPAGPRPPERCVRASPSHGVHRPVFSQNERLTQRLSISGPDLLLSVPCFQVGQS